MMRGKHSRVDCKRFDVDLYFQFPFLWFKVINGNRRQ